MSDKDSPGSTAQLWGRFLHKGAWPIVIMAMLFTALSVYYTVTHLTFRTNRSDLISRDQKLIELKNRMEQEFGSRDSLVVVVENKDRRRSIAFAEALADVLRQHPRNFSELFYRIDIAPMRPYVLQYLEPADLQELKQKLGDQRQLITGLAADPSLNRFFQVINEEMTRAMIGELFTDFLQEPGTQALPDLKLLNGALGSLQRFLEGGAYASPLAALLPQGFGNWEEEGYFFTDNDQYLLFLVSTPEGNFSASQESVALLRQAIAQVKARFPDIIVGLTGSEALEVDEMTEALRDMTLATWLSLVSQLLLLILFFRSVKRTLVEGLCLVIGICWTFGMATVLVGHLNLLSMIFAPLMLGMTIDYGIHWFCRLEEEQNGSRCQLAHLVSTLKNSAPGITYAALAAAATFMPLIFTGFKGLAELGLILMAGIILMLVVTLVVQPALVVLFERCRDSYQFNGAPGHPRPFLSLQWRRPALVAALGLGLMLLGGYNLRHVPFDLNPLNLQNPKTESVVWELKLLAGSRYSSVYGAMMVSSPQEITEKARALKSLPTVSHVESILSFLPENGRAKLAILEDLQPLFAPIDFAAHPPAATSPAELAVTLSRIKFKLSQALDNISVREEDLRRQVQEAVDLLGRLLSVLENPGSAVAARLTQFEGKFSADLKEKWDLLKANIFSKVPVIEDLPETVRERFSSPQGSYLIRVFPAQDIWDMSTLAKFVADLRRVDPDVVGEPVLLYVFTSSFRNACLWAVGVGLLGITVMLVIFFRDLKLTLLALIPLLVGTGWTLNLMWLLDLSFNQANVLFLPLILGEGIEFGIIILARWKLEASARAITLPASTAKGVALAALTTTAGFGSLMVSGHQGTFSLGLLATVGSLSVLLASLSVLPAILRLLEKKRSERFSVNSCFQCAGASPVSIPKEK